MLNTKAPGGMAFSSLPTHVPPSGLAGPVILSVKDNHKVCGKGEAVWNHIPVNSHGREQMAMLPHVTDCKSLNHYIKLRTQSV